MNYPIIKNIPIDEIIVEYRRREDFGDIEGLAESIRRFGLFHPLIVDDKNSLVAGERRLRALRLLGWSEIPVRPYADLSDDERNEIELEENLKRKDLTSIEISRQIVRQAKQIAPLISSTVGDEINQDMGLADSNLISSIGEEIKNPNSAGRKSLYGVPKKEVAKALGISEGSLINAEQHVEAVEKYPEIVSVPTRKDAINIAKTLDSADEKKQKEIRADLAQGKLGKVTKLNKQEEEENENPSNHFEQILNKIFRHINSINLHGGVAYAWSGWSKQEKLSYYTRIKDLAEKTNNYVLEMEEQLNEQA